METFLRKPELIKEKRNLVEDELDMNMYLFKYGIEADYFIIILEGSAIVQVGKEGMEINAGLFSYYGVDALVDENDTDPLKAIANEKKHYTPEFSLKVNSYCVYLQITRRDWIEAVNQSIIERRANINILNNLNNNNLLLEGKSLGNLAASNSRLNDIILEKKNNSTKNISLINH